MFGFRMRVETDRASLVLRPYRSDEVPVFSEGLQHYEVCRYLSMNGVFGEKFEQEWLEKMASDRNAHLWAICLPEEDERPIGHTTIHVKGVSGSTGVTIYDRSQWGRGVVTAAHLARTRYAIEALDLMALHSGAATANKASLRALKRVGYAHAGFDYHFGFADGRVTHVETLLLVNPAERAWNYFWGDTKHPKRFHEARQRTIAAMELARQVVSWD